MNGDGTHDRTRHTVREAAGVLGISAEAVRARIRRNTLPHVKDAEGTVYVLLESDDRTDERSYGDGTGDSTHDRTALVEALQSEISYLREEARRRDERHAEEILRRDHIIAAALERIPAIESPEAPREPRTGHESNAVNAEAPAHHPEDGSHQEATERPAGETEPAPARSWWQRIFGG